MDLEAKGRRRPFVFRAAALLGRITTLAALLGAGSAPAGAEVLDNLLDRLRSKGIISQSEYDELRGEMRAERDKQKEAAGDTASAKLRDGFLLQSGEGRHAVRVSGRIHADYRAFSNDSGTAAAANAGSADTFDVRRAYLGVSGRFYGEWTFAVIADFAQSGSALDVAWINYGGLRPAQVKVGQFKMPFSLEELTSSRFLEFQERAFGNALVPGKERGIMVHGAPLAALYYGLALSNGQGKNANEPNAAVDDKDVIGRVAVNLAEMTSSSDAVIHAGGGFTKGKLPVAAAPSARTEARGLTFFAPAAFTGTPGLQEMERERSGAEMSLAWNQFKLQSEWIKARFTGTTNGGLAYDRDIVSSYVSFNWLITGEKFADAYRDGAFGAIKPRQELRPGGGWGAWQVGVRYSKWDASDFATTNPAGSGALGAGLTSQATAWTLGLKWIPNTNTRVYLNLVNTKFDTPVEIVNATADHEKAITMRAAFYF